MEITQKDVQDLFKYNAETGELLWRYKSSPRAVPDAVAGSLYNTGYLRIKIKGKRYLAHRLIWLYVTGNFPEKYIDHINGIRSDNRLCNLREVSKLENNRNAKKRKDNTSGHTGVFWNKLKRKWEVAIGVGKGLKYLGSFSDKHKAVACRVAAEKEYGYSSTHGYR